MIASAYFSTEAKKMDPAARYARFVHSSDKKGHSTTIRVDVAPGVMEAISEFIASRTHPYFRTPKDFMRVALGLLLDEMSQMDGCEALERAAKVYRRWQVTEDALTYQAVEKQTVDGVCTLLDRAHTVRERINARAVAVQVLADLDDPEYRSKIETRLSHF